jgi:hypothetical protein
MCIQMTYMACLAMPGNLVQKAAITEGAPQIFLTHAQLCPIPPKFPDHKSKIPGPCDLPPRRKANIPSDESMLKQVGQRNSRHERINVDTTANRVVRIARKQRPRLCKCRRIANHTCHGPATVLAGRGSIIINLGFVGERYSIWGTWLVIHDGAQD